MFNFDTYFKFNLFMEIVILAKSCIFFIVLIQKGNIAVSFLRLKLKLSTS